MPQNVPTDVEFAALSDRVAALETRVTALETATPPEPIDCELSEWTLASVSEWGPCQPEGTQSRIETWTRSILTEPAHGGTPCGPLREDRIVTQTCTYLPPTPVDCVLSEWTLTIAGPWGPCQPDGTQTRIETWVRTIVTEPMHGGAACGSLSETRTGSQACTYVPPAPTGDPDWDAFTADPRLLRAYPMHSQAEVDTYPTRGKTPRAIPPIYDATADAVRFTIMPGQVIGTDVNGNPISGTNNPQQKHLAVAIPFGTSFFLRHDQWMDEGFRYIEDGDNDMHTGWLDTFKSFRFDPQDNIGEKIWLTLKHQFAKASRVGEFAEIEVTCPANVYTIPGESSISGERLQPRLATFYQRANLRTRVFVLYEFVDADRGLLSIWFADREQGVIQAFRQLPWKFPPHGVQWYRLQRDTSFDQEFAKNPTAHAYDRHIGILQGVTYADVGPLLTVDGL